MKKDGSLSILICTYNRAELLKECIASVLPQLESSCGRKVDLIIIDNNSTDTTHKVVKSFNNAKIKYVFEEQQGLSHARNKGYQSTNSEWVAYLDDDALANDDWVKRIFWIIENTNFDAFGGIYTPWYRDGKADWYLDEYATNKTWMKYTKITLLKKQMFSGGNCVFRRNLLCNEKGFPTHLGMKGDIIAYGEETLVQERLRRKGYKLGFDPDLLIKHYVAPYKQTTRWFFKQSKASGKAYWQSCHVEPTWSKLLLTLLLSPLLLARDISTCLERLLKKEYGVTNAYILVGKSLTFNLSKLLSGIRQKVSAFKS